MARKSGNTQERGAILVICEGEKTEPSYFDGFKRNASIPSLIHVEGTGSNTLSLIDEALALKKRLEKTGRKFDQVWAVFDRDSFPSSNFDNAISKGISQGVHCAYSNEAFELWYLLHFKYLDTAHDRAYLKTELSKELEKAGYGSYLKNVMRPCFQGRHYV